ncbi:hypothetical protein HCH54_005203 [Aspergillus fumigatus]
MAQKLCSLTLTRLENATTRTPFARSLKPCPAIYRIRPGEEAVGFFVPRHITTGDLRNSPSDTRVRYSGSVTLIGEAIRGVGPKYHKAPVGAADTHRTDVEASTILQLCSSLCSLNFSCHSWFVSPLLSASITCA